MYHIKTIGTALFVILSLDFIWLGFVGKGFYIDEIGQLMKAKPSLLSAAFVYVLLTLGTTILVLPMAGDDHIAALYYGAIFGFVCYGIYDFTNLAIIDKWTLKISIIDMLWGTFVCSMASFAASFMK